MTARAAPFVVALDPGTRHAGLALVERAPAGGTGPTVRWATSIALPAKDEAIMISTLRGALYDAKAGPRFGVTDLVVEWPRKYASHRAAWDDVDGLRRVAGSIARASWASVTKAAPGTWKNNVPKNIHHARVEGRLSAAERASVWDGLGVDGRDAVALGLWYVSAYPAP